MSHLEGSSELDRQDGRNMLKVEDIDVRKCSGLSYFITQNKHNIMKILLRKSFAVVHSKSLWSIILHHKRYTCKGDQIEVFKIVNGYEDVDRNMFFKLKEGSRTRGHKAALVKEQCRLDMRKYSFSQRVINEWNKLPNNCVNASSVNVFKNRIDRYLIRVGYT